MKSTLPEAKKFNLIALIINLAIPLIIGAVGSYFTSNGVNTWYPTIVRPSFNPPNWIFAPVWTTIFILMGISAYRVWQKRDQIAQLSRTTAIYLIQLLLNLMWSFLFFSLNLIGGALFEIVALLLAIFVNARMFYKIDKLAGLLFIPYLLWVSFATILTLSIFMLN